ncbi:MAG: GNAT family N-acetyltransferase [Ktedonobacteraceae bacterium]
MTEADIEAVWKLRLRALQNNPEAFSGTYVETLAYGIERYAERLRSEGDNFWLGAFVEGRLVGMVGFRRAEGIKNQHKGMLLGMYMVPEVRGHGIGKALVNELIARAKNIEGLEQIHLEVVTTNEAARSLYRLLGFEVCGVTPRGLKMGHQYWDEELMVLRFK